MDGSFPSGYFPGKRKRVELKALVFAVKGKLFEADLISAIGEVPILSAKEYRDFVGAQEVAVFVVDGGKIGNGKVDMVALKGEWDVLLLVAE